MRIVQTILILAALGFGVTVFGLLAAAEAARDHNPHLNIGAMCGSSPTPLPDFSET